MKYMLIILLSISNLMIAAPSPWQDAQKDTKAEEYRKKSSYYKIKADLEEGRITLKQAQALWKKQLVKFRKKKEDK